ncbi:hypothetical protein MPTK1_2g18490 [Marchantia polymorpha subsp. ruderalis]|uniref:Tyrosine-protein phosphatase domain-containing protein n=1 Tax=Marchantia polymorpha TaxID=3197 RepID=A0A2R6W743_MARPO|nr:hypothetical protein MARPO_0137s0032 [Marchantia polymorpha]BBN02830.1 hypothetical protein Mp_2g18490 [Marchantia polymorpha subsp. ruderalis]|eukprot:PTQ29665.1 hypothetical protein MARPO_0137s0032 [Marchantia polymorpha]
MAAMVAYMSVPDAYGVVEPGVYRAKAAAAPNLPFLLHLRLRTLLYLSPDPLLPSFTAFLDKCATRFIHLGLRVWKPYATWKPVSEELIKDALEIVLDVNTHPIMVMCSSGIHQTGTVVGCLRRLQKWNLTSLLEEYRRYAGSKARYANEQFMELFDEDLVTLPKDLPAWFIDQRRMMEEEEADFRRSQESAVQQINGGSSSPLTWLEASPLGNGSSNGHVSGNAQRTDEENGEDTSKPLATVKTPTDVVNYRKFYYLRSSPLTTEDRSYKRKIIGKVE